MLEPASDTLCGLDMGEYVLGTSDHELARLGLQQEVWKPVTDRFLDALGLRPGMCCLDAGCGPGYLVRELRERVGPSGHVDALDESPRWIEHVRGVAAEEGWTNVGQVEGRLEELDLAPGSYDLIVLRWVLGFLPEPAAVVARLAAALRPGGVLAVQDYNHEGVSVFPDSGAFRAMIRATRALYASRGGDTWIAGRCRGLFRAAGLETFHWEPTVLGGDRESPVFRWLDAFFPYHSDGFLERGLISAEEHAAFGAEWAALAADPDATFYSPIVVAMAARRPGPR